jgi:2-phospho-L-lactate/phosphoenolpyruvate guanylyltransferase
MTMEVWAAVPVKSFSGAKQRLSSLLSPAQRERLAATMVEDVLSALAGAHRLAGIMVNTIDPVATELAHKYGAHVVTRRARDGHTGAVDGMREILAEQGRGALLTLPGDLPNVTPGEIDSIIASALAAPSFTIVPAHDELGSNAVLVAPPQRIPLRFGDDSFFPHLATARKHGLEPTVVRLPGVALDIDHPVDLKALMAVRPRRWTRTLALLETFGL